MRPEIETAYTQADFFAGLYLRQYGMAYTAGNKRPLDADLDPAAGKNGRSSRPGSELHTFMLDASVGWNEFSKFVTDSANTVDLMNLSLLQLQKIVSTHPIQQAGIRGQKKVILVARIEELLNTEMTC